MYCRTCGNKMNDNAEICVKCGVRRNVGTEYCQVCGTKTNATMKTCGKCKAVLKTALSSSQIKKTATSGIKKFFGNTALFLSILLMCAGAVQFIMGFMARSGYYATNRFTGAGRCFLLAATFFVIAKVIKGKTKKKKK